MRLGLVLKAKLARLLDRFEDPLATLDYAYERHQGVLREVNRSLIDAVANRKRLEFQAAQLSQRIDKYDVQARDALKAGREDLARAALERKQGLEATRGDLEQQIDQLKAQQERLARSQQAFSEQLQALRSEKESVRAQYLAAAAMVAFGEATSGLGRELQATGLMIERAQEKTRQVQARAAALGELSSLWSAGPLDEIGQLSASAQVEAELAALKSSLAPAVEPSADSATLSL